MAEGGKLDFLSKEVAGLPGWAWVVIVGAGIAAAYIVPKFIGGKSSSTTAQPTATDATGQGLGLAIDPTTGLPYAVEGLVPSGGLAGTGGTQGPQGPAGPQGPQGTPGTSLPCPPQPCPQVAFPDGSIMVWNPTTCKCERTGGGTTKPPVPPAKTPGPVPTPAHYVTVTPWPTPLSTLFGIASKYGISLAKIEQLNPQIKDPNLIFAGQQVRIS